MGVRNAKVRGLFISDRDSEFYLRLKPVARRKNMICLRQIFGRLDTLGPEIHSLVRKVTRENKFYLMSRSNSSSRDTYRILCSQIPEKYREIEKSENARNIARLMRIITTSFTCDACLFYDSFATRAECNEVALSFNAVSTLSLLKCRLPYGRDEILNLAYVSTAPALLRR